MRRHVDTRVCIALALLIILGIGLPLRQLIRRTGTHAPDGAVPGSVATPTLAELTPEGRAFSFPEEGSDPVLHQVVVTAYTSRPRETDATPFVTASMTRVRTGCLALSRDLLRTFTKEAPFEFGDWVVLPGIGVFVVQDTMHPRWRNRADIWFPDLREALRWGRRPAFVAQVPNPIQETDALFALGPVAWDPASLRHE